MKDQIYGTIDRFSDRFKQISLFIGRNPELGHEEVKAMGALTEELRYHGFEVETGMQQLETSFLAVYESTKPGPIVAYLCEYDALPDLGHACGHHLICTMSLSAAVGLKSVIDQIGGTIRVYGTPAEETKGAKVTFAEAGMFDDVDFVLMAHPYHGYEKSGRSLAMDAIRFEFQGKAAHAAAAPHEGINALDGVIQLFNSINALRQQTRSDTRIHGIITDGGHAPNIIPDFAAANFYIRSADRPYTDELVKKVVRCAEGAALQTGCSMSWHPYELSYDDLITNAPLSELFTRNLCELGVDETAIGSGQDHGSLDLGNVSRRCPAIHPFVQVIDERHNLHTEQFRDLALTDRALEGMLLAAKALAGTAYDVLANPNHLQSIRSYFNESVSS
jgi:amidohydrolase